jgi:hypothetical protein
VREDYSEYGAAWEYFPHDHARSRAYRWNEDGLGGICDRHQRICFAVALWNGRDPILKERLFGLTGTEGNHGEDVKEYYFYLDSTPTHSYMKFLYKYPQAAFPYAQLVEENRRRDKHAPEYELVETGVFDGGRYFDVQIEYAKADVEDILIRIRVTNRGPEAARIDVLPTAWFRNTWSWFENATRPMLEQCTDSAVMLREPRYGTRYLHYCCNPQVLFTENETNGRRLFGDESASPYAKDSFHRVVVNGEAGAVNPQHVGTKAAAWGARRRESARTRLGGASRLLEPMTIAQKGITQAYEIQRRLKVWRPRRAAVMGSGTLGLLASLVLRLRGLDVTTFGRTPRPYLNADLLDVIGARYVNSAEMSVLDAAARYGPWDLVFEGTGSSSVVFDSMQTIAKNGVLVLSSITGGSRRLDVPADRINLDFVLGNKVMVGTVNASRENFENGVRDMAEAELEYPGWLARLLTNPRERPGQLPGAVRAAAEPERRHQDLL